MTLSNTSVLKQSDNAAGDVYENRRPSSSEKTRIAFIEVLRGVYMKKKGDTIPWSDIKKGYRKKTGRHLNGDELNAICGTKNLTKGEIIRTKFSPLFKFVDEKYQIITVSSNDCGGSGQHDENEFFCESCIKCGKMIASEIKFSESSSSSNDENHSPRIDSASSDVSNNYPSNTALHMESVEIESAYDTVFQENAEVEAPVALPVQSPDALVQAAPEESKPELTTNEPEVKTPKEPEAKATMEPETKVTMEPEAKVTMEPEVTTPTEPEVKATNEPEEDVILNEVTEKSNKTDLETEADKELAVEKREKAHELMHRRRKAKCCNLM